MLFVAVSSCGSRAPEENNADPQTQRDPPPKGGYLPLRVSTELFTSTTTRPPPHGLIQRGALLTDPRRREKKEALRIPTYGTPEKPPVRRSAW